MKNVILFASLILALSSCDRKSYHVKGGTAISGNFRKATVDELIEHFKIKEE